MDDDLKKLLEEKKISLSKGLSYVLSQDESTIKLPRGLVKDVIKNFKKFSLKDVHKDRETASELILLILSNFTFTWVREAKLKGNYTDNNFIQLNSKLLKRQVGTGSNKARYKIILKLLINNNFLQKGLGYKKNVKSNSYRINDKYYNKNIEEYKLKTSYAIKQHKKNIQEKLLETLENKIALNELQNLNRIELPTREEVLNHLKYYSKRSWKNKKGKQLKVLGKKKRENKYVYVEDYLKLYQILKSNFNTPKTLGENAGHRVVTKFNMMPSLIRALFKVTGSEEKLIGLDFSCFHPALSVRIYLGPNNPEITHEDVANFLKKQKKFSKLNFKELRKISKKEHLSFFNMKIEHLRKSKIYKYYKEKHPELLHKVENDKIEKGYKHTSKLLFKAETRIMTEIVKRCQKRGIITIYVYDELLVQETRVEEVRKIMQQVCSEQKLNIKIK